MLTALLILLGIFIALLISASVTGGTGAESYNVRDGALALALAGPAAASSTVTSTGIDTGETTALAVQPGNWEFLLSAPALSATILPNGTTMTYSIVAADSADLSSNPTTLVAGAIVQTGAGGAGAPAATYRFRLPSVCQRYVGFTIASGVSTTSAVGVSATLTPVF